MSAILGNSDVFFSFIFLRKKRNKLDTVFWKGIFVGYHSSIQARVFNPETGKISWHTAVIFQEDSLGGRLLENSGRSEEAVASIFDEDDTDR